MTSQADTTKRLTRRQAAIIGAYTGVTAGSFSDIHGYAEKVLGRPVFTHEFASEKVAAELKDAAREDFLAICHREVDDGDAS